MIKNIEKYAVLFLAGFVFTNCAVGPDYQQPEDATPQSFRHAEHRSDSLLNLNWWQFFDDPVLDTLVVKALKNNKNVLIAASRVEQARENVGYIKADRAPSFSYSGSASRTNFPQNAIITDQPSNNFNSSVGMNWELDFWGKYKRGNEAAKAELLSSFYGKKAVEIALISEVATNYFQLLDYKTRLDISEKTLANRDSTLLIIEARFEKGYTHVIDVNQAEIQKAVAQSSVPQFKRFIAFTENNLSVLLGESPDEIETLISLKEYTFPDEIPTGIPSDILRRRPDVLQAEQDYRAQNAYVGVATAMRFPSISLTGILGVGSNDLSNLLDHGLGWGAAAGITGPLFEFGKNARRVDIEREKAKQYLLNYEYIVLTAMQEVSNALIEIQTLEEELIANELRLKAANNASYLSRKRYYEGVTSYLEVIENQRQEFDAELVYSDNFQQLLSAHVKLYKALGGGWSTEEELEKYAQQRADELNIDVNTIDKDTLYYQGQVVDLVLSEEEIKARKEAKKQQRKLEREQKRAQKQN